MGHSSGGFRYQVHASYLCQGSSTGGPGDEFTEPLLEEVATTQNTDEKSIGTIFLQEPSFWKVYIEGATNQRGSGVGLVLISPEQITIEKSLRLGFSTTNNEAEYEALLEGMSKVQKIGGKAVKMFLDSRLVVG